MSKPRLLILDDDARYGRGLKRGLDRRFSVELAQDVPHAKSRLEAGVDDAPRSICDVAPTLRQLCDLPARGGDGRTLTGPAAEAVLKYMAGAFPGSPAGAGAMCAFAPYDLENVKVVGYDVVANRPKVAAYRAPGAPIAEYGVECVVDELARELGIDPVDFRLNNAAHQGTKAAYGPTFGPVGLVETLKAVKEHPQYCIPLGPNQGRGVASGFWFNIGGETCASLNVNEDGTVTLMAGTPDIGGSRASLGLMAAEELGIDYDKVRPLIADTSSRCCSSERCCAFNRQRSSCSACSNCSLTMM